MKKSIYISKLFNSILYLFKYLSTFFIIMVITSYFQSYFKLNDDFSFSISLILSAFCFYILLKLENKDPIKYLNLKVFKFKYFYLIILLSLSIVLLDSTLVFILENILNIQVPNNNSITFYRLLHIIFLAPIYEEIFFRGIILTKLKQNFPAFIAIIFQAIIFGFFHGDVITKILSTITGIILGSIYNYTNNLTIVICIHSCINIFIAIFNIYSLNINPILATVLSGILVIICIKKVTIETRPILE